VKYEQWMKSYSRSRRQRWSASTGSGVNKLGEQPRRRGVVRDIFTAEAKRARRVRRIRNATLVLLGLAVLAAAGYWWATRPASVEIVAVPEDAEIVFMGESYVGTVDVGGLEPGEYDVVVSRTGFEPEQATVELGRGGSGPFVYELRSLPQTLTVTSFPEGAGYSIEAADGNIVTGVTPFAAQVPAGRTVITLTADGHETHEREFFLAQETHLELLLDPEGQLVGNVSASTTTGRPLSLALSPDASEVWVNVFEGDSAVEIRDTGTGQLMDSIVLGEYGGTEILMTPDGSRAYVSQMETARVYEIDTATREALRTFDTDSQWSKALALSPEGSTLYVANWTAQDISVIDLATGSVTRKLASVPTPRSLYATPDGAYLYVAGFEGGEIQKIALDTGLGRVVFDDGAAVAHLAGDEKRGLLYASDMALGTVWELDMETDEVTQLATTDQKPSAIDLSPDGAVLFVACRGANNEVNFNLPGPEWGTVLLIDTDSGEPLDAVVGGNQVTALDVSREGDTLVFSDFLDDRVRTYDVPPTDELRSGGGGLYGPHLELLKKK
jgi:YVTN family beta-propeller protein